MYAPKIIIKMFAKYQQSCLIFPADDELTHISVPECDSRFVVFRRNFDNALGLLQVTSKLLIL